MFETLKRELLLKTLKAYALYGKSLIFTGRKLFEIDKEAGFFFISAGMSMTHPTHLSYMLDHGMRSPWLIYSPARFKQMLGACAAGLVEGHYLGTQSDSKMAKLLGGMYIDNLAFINDLEEQDWFKEIMSWAKPLRLSFDDYYASAEALFEMLVMTAAGPKPRFTAGPKGIEDLVSITRELYKQFMTGKRREVVLPMVSKYGGLVDPSNFCKKH